MSKPPRVDRMPHVRIDASELARHASALVLALEIWLDPPTPLPGDSAPPTRFLSSSAADEALALARSIVERPDRGDAGDTLLRAFDKAEEAARHEMARASRPKARRKWWSFGRAHIRSSNTRGGRHDSPPALFLAALQKRRQLILKPKRVPAAAAK